MNGIPYKTPLKYDPYAKRWICLFRYDPRRIEKRYSIGNYFYKKKPDEALAEIEQAFKTWVTENCR